MKLQLIAPYKEMREFDENDLINSSLNQRYTSEGKTVRIEIYRMPGTLWTLEVIDESGNSTVWDEEFKTDAEALSLALTDLGRDGIDEFIGPPPNS